MEFKKVLKILAKEGYPNPKLDNIFDAIDYDGEWFLSDLVKHLGEQGATEFVGKALNKLSSGTNSDIQIKIPEIVGYSGSWVNIIIHSFYIGLDETETDVLVNYSWGENKIIDEDGNETTIEEMSDDVDMDGMSDWEEFIDWLRSAAYNYISTRCGFGIWWQ